MNHVEIHWDIEAIKNIKIAAEDNPYVGFDTVANDTESYKHLISAGVHRGLPDCFDLDIFEKEFDWLDNKSYAVLKMVPGSILPLHRDRYSYFSQQNNITDLDQIVRVIVFLEDQKIGHILQIENQEVNAWRAGDYVYWHGKKMHMAANLGNEDRFTLQITGIINNQI